MNFRLRYFRPFLLSCKLIRTKMVFLVFDTSAPLRKISLGSSRTFTPSELNRKVKEHLEQLFGCGNFDFYLLHNGKLLSDKLIEGEVHVVPRLLGGKGGFGSMLRAIGAQIEKTTNREACRDLSGRRLRDINEEKRLKKWIAEQAEREQEALERKKKKLEKLNKEIKHEFADEEYTKTRLEMPDKIHEAVEQGLQVGVEEAASSQDCKVAKANEPVKKKVKRKFWVDDLLDDVDDSELDESDGESPRKKIKLS